MEDFTAIAPMKRLFCLGLLLCCNASISAQESLPPLVGGKVPQDLVELWGGFDPRKEAVEAEITKEWEKDGIVCRVVRYKVGDFKGEPVRVAGFYAFPKGASRLPGLLQIHGGGQSANLDTVRTDALRGYASLSINWGGNKMRMGQGDIYDGPNTDWGKLDATHPPQRNPANHFAGGIAPDDFTLDKVVSPRNDNWFLVVLAARRALTFLEQQPEVDHERLGVYGHSMGGRLTTQLTGIDKRVKAAVPSCGGSGDLLESQMEVPGGKRTKPTPLELACVSENGYIRKVTTPVLWLSPTNDFHAHMENMAYTWRDVPDDLLRLSVSPHFNHRHSDSSQITQHLWFEEHLKKAFQMPKTPQLVVNLRTADGIPAIIVTPDAALPVKGVDIYFSTDPHGVTRFWRDARSVRNGSVWTAQAPVAGLEQPLFVFANVIYETPSQYRNLPLAPGQGNSAVFALSSREFFAPASDLVNAGVRPTDETERLIDDGSRGWHDWYRLNGDNPYLWTAVTRKTKDAKWRGPDGGKLVFEINPSLECSIIIKVTSNDWGAFSSGPKAEFSVEKKLRGAGEWETVSVEVQDLVCTDPKNTALLANWLTVNDLALSTSGEIVQNGRRVKVETKGWKSARDAQVRNLRWEGGVYKSVQAKGGGLSGQALEKSFNEAIRKSLEQEKLDGK